MSAAQEEAKLVTIRNELDCPNKDCEQKKLRIQQLFERQRWDSKDIIKECW